MLIYRTALVQILVISILLSKGEGKRGVQILVISILLSKGEGKRGEICRQHSHID